MCIDILIDFECNCVTHHATTDGDDFGMVGQEHGYLRYTY